MKKFAKFLAKVLLQITVVMITFSLIGLVIFGDPFAKFQIVITIGRIWLGYTVLTGIASLLAWGKEIKELMNEFFND